MKIKVTLITNEHVRGSSGRFSHYARFPSVPCKLFLLHRTHLFPELKSAHSPACLGDKSNCSENDDQILMPAGLSPGVGLLINYIKINNNANFIEN